MKNKRDFIIGIGILGIGLLIIAFIIIYGSKISREKPVLFTQGKTKTAEKIYNELMSYDFENDYPETPEKVVDIFNQTIRIIYGNMIVDEEIMKSVLSVQRSLYTDEINYFNPIEEQYETLMEDLDIIFDDNVMTLSLERERTFYNPADSNECIVPVIQHTTKLDPLYWNNYMIKENDKWKIASRQATDETFRE